jgi:hypothetical protein
MEESCLYAQCLTVWLSAFLLTNPVSRVQSVYPHEVSWEFKKKTSVGVLVFNSSLYASFHNNIQYVQWNPSQCQ